MNLPRELRVIAGLIWPLVSQRSRARLLVGFLALLLASILNGVIPLLFASIIDQANGRLTSEQTVAQALLLLAVCYAVLTYFASLLLDVGPFFFGHVEQGVIRTLSLRLLNRLLRMQLRDHEERNVGATGQILVSGINGARMLFQHASYTIIPVAVEMITVIAIVLHMGKPALLLVFTVTAAAYLCIFAASSRRVVKPASALTNASISANSIFSDALLNFEAVATFSAQTSIATSYEGALARAEHSWHKIFRIRLITGAAVAAVSALSIGLVMAISLPAIDAGGMTIGQLVLVCTYMLRIAVPLQMVGVALRDSTEAVAYLRSMVAILNTLHDDRAEASQVQVAGEGPASIGFEAVSFSYSAGRVVLRDISLRVVPGTTVALVGASGSGKSTIARLLLRICQPTSGRVLIDDHDTSYIDEQLLRSQIAIVPQDTILFNTSVAANICVGMPKASLSQITEAARIAGLDPLISTLPDGLQTIVGERGMKLSGGERQRIAIARAYIRNPRIIILDEATSSLDSVTEGQVLRRLASARRGATTIIIAHRLATVSHADQILVLHDGQISERGTHEELLRAEGAYKTMWSSQIGAPQFDSG